MQSTQTLTDRQAQVLRFVRDYIAATGYPPTRVDIARELGFRSANAAEEHLRALARKGVIELMPGRSRGLRLVVSPDGEVPSTRPSRGAGQANDTGPLLGLPLIGKVAAGQPVLAIEHVEDHIAVAPALFHPRADFLLRVRGDSMVGAGIHEGDLLAVHSQTSANSSEIVVARLDDEVTVKRWRRDGNSPIVELVAENPEYAPIVVDLRERELAIEGKVVGLIRRS